MRQALRRRVLVAFYAVLAIAVAIVAALVISAGEDEMAQPPIAGGYDVAGRALPRPDRRCQAVRQFVNLDNADGTVGGQLRFEDGQLTGDVECTDGATQDLDATVADGIISGTLGGQPLEAEFKRDPPAPGSPKPRAARTLDGPYKVTPVSACLGSKFTLEGGGSTYERTFEPGDQGEISYVDGLLTGTVTCKTGEEWTLTGTSVDRNIENLIFAPRMPRRRLSPEPSPRGREGHSREAARSRSAHGWRSSCLRSRSDARRAVLREYCGAAPPASGDG